MWLDFKDPRNGERRRIPSGFKTEADAQKNALAVITRWLAAQEHAAAVSSDLPGVSAVADSQPKKGTSMTFKQAFEKGLRERDKWLKAKDKTTLRQTFAGVASYWGGDDAPLAKATRQAVLDWRKAMTEMAGKRKGQPLSHSTINHRLSMLTILLEQAELPAHGVKHLSTRGNGRERRITDKEIEDMRGWLLARPERPGTIAMAALITMGLETAARQGELLGLPWADVAERSVTFRNTKNGRSRTIPLRREARELVANRRYVAGGPFHDLTQDRATALWDAARTGIGLAQDEHFVFHCLRHEKLSRMADDRVNGMVIQAYAGHENITTTQRYVHASFGAMEEALGITAED